MTAQLQQRVSLPYSIACIAIVTGAIEVKQRGTKELFKSGELDYHTVF